MYGKWKSYLLNNHFADKATVEGSSNTPHTLQKTDVLSSLIQINTSPLEVGKIIRDCKKSHQSYCGAPGKFLSMISTPISFPLSIMFNTMVFSLIHLNLHILQVFGSKRVLHGQSSSTNQFTRCWGRFWESVAPWPSSQTRTSFSYSY